MSYNLYLQEVLMNKLLVLHVQFKTQVLEVKRIHCPMEHSRTGYGQKWEVTTAPVLDSTQAVSQEYDAVIVCNGYLRQIG